jgi:hypothetical protein
MTETHPTAVRQEAQALALYVGGQRAALAVVGQRDATLDDAAERLAKVMMRAGTIEANEPPPLVAAMETLDPQEFGRRVRARRRMTALRKRTAKPKSKSGDPFPKPPSVEPLSAAVETKVVRRG